MALTGCIQKAGKTLSPADRDFLLREILEGRTDEQALANLEQVVQDEIDVLIDQVEASGVNIRLAPTTDYIEESRLSDQPPQDYVLTKEDNQRLTKLKKQVPGLGRVLKWLQPDEQAAILSKEGAARLVEQLGDLPSTKEIMAVAEAGRAKRGWYTNSQRAIEEVFGADAPRFTALLAALSPKSSVEVNTEAALRTWVTWVTAGRPTSTRAIMQILGKSVQGQKGESSVMDAWRNNVFRALTAEDPGSIALSGPKVNSFMLNLLGYQNEVTSDAWMGHYTGIDATQLGVNTAANLPSKSPAYMAMSIAIRKAAQRLGWTPAEVQETVWSFNKILYEKAHDKFSGRYEPGRTALDILQSGDLTHEEIGSTVDFEKLFLEGKYRTILESGGYSLDEVQKSVRRREASEDKGSIEATPELNRVAKRLDKLGADRVHASMRVEIAVNLSAATDSIPGLQTLSQEASEGNEESALLLQEVAWDSLKYLTRGIKSIVMTRTLAQGVFKKGEEPSLDLDIQFAEGDRERTLAALARFATNFNQEQIHVRQPVRYQRLGRTFADGSYITSVLTFTLDSPLTSKQGRRLVKDSGIEGVTITDDAVEVYFVGDHKDEQAVKAYAEATEKLEKLLGGNVREMVQGRSRIWAYGSGSGATAGFDAIERDIHPPKEDLASDTTQRIASRLAGRAVTPTKQAPSVTETKAAIQRLIAEQYELMELDALDNPTVRRAYEELAAELLEQYDALPIKVEVWTQEGEVYLDSKGRVSSKKMRRDVLGRNHLYIYKTDEDSFGPAGIVYDDHPMLAPSGRTDMNGTPLLINDLLRAVHDYYAHTMSTNTFGPTGEEGAWLNHMMMTRSPWARWALTSETRGQNSWVNFRAGVENMPLGERGFSEQKVDLLPLEFLLTGQADIDSNLAELPGSDQLGLEPEFYAQSVYHGSGVSGIRRLSTDFMLTGEGFHAFGWGLYFTSRKQIAKFYKDSVGGGVEVSFDGELIDYSEWESAEIDPQVFRDLINDGYIETLGKYTAILDSENEQLLVLKRVVAGMDRKWGRPEQLVGPQDEFSPTITRENLHRNAIVKMEVQSMYVSDIELSVELIKTSKGKVVTIKEPGGLYQANLVPKEDEYLSWFDTLADQPQHVQDRILKALNTGRRENTVFPPVTLEDKVFAGIPVGEMNGAQMYEMMSQVLGSQKMASLTLRDLGIRGIRYQDSVSRGLPAGMTFNYVIFDDADVQDLEQLEQKDRAKYFPDVAGERIIQLTKSADLSSFLHESGHLFLDTQKLWAEKYGTNENQEAILEWLEVENWDQIGVEEHERWAETFEVYLREGKAPSLKLRRAFHSFAKWLKRIYVTLTTGELSRADLSPEIVEIFDRLLATEAEIEENAASPEYQQFYRSQEQAGMTDEAWAAYQAQAKKAKDTAEMNIDEKILKEYKKQKSAEWAAEKAPMIEQEKERLALDPIYKLLSDLYVEKNDKGEIINETRMDWHKLRDAVGEWPKGNFAGKAVGGGVDPGLYSDLYGYDSIKDMYDTVNAAPTLKQAAEQAAEERMKQKHGDILNDGTLEMEVREALMNDEQAKLLLIELRNENRGETQKLNRKYLKAEAEALIAKMKFKDINPDKYYRAMIKFAQKAMTGEDPHEAKLGQLANHYLYKAALATKEKMVKNRRKVKKAQSTSHKPNKVDQRYNEAMIALATAYDMRLKPEERFSFLAKVLDFYAGQVDPNNPTSELINLEMLDPNMIEAIRIRIENPAIGYGDFVVKTFDDLTSVELEGVVDMLAHLRYVGGQMTDLGNLEMKAARDAGVLAIEEMGGKDSKFRPGRQQPLRDAKLTWADTWDSIPSIGNMIRKLDGFKPGGWAFENIYQKITAGLNRKFEVQERMYDMMQEAMGDLPSVGLSLRDKAPITLESGIEDAFSSEEIFMIAVYWGTESSRRAIMDGHGLTENDVMALMGRLTPPQLKMVNQVWVMNESQWPELQAAAKAVLGIAPPKLEATPFNVNGIQMTGGHMQLMYDSIGIEMKDEQSRGMKTSDVAPMQAGSTIARVGSGGKAPLLSVHNITQSVEEKTHYIAFAEIGRDLRAILNNREIQEVIVKKHGPRFYHNLIHAISAVTAAEKPTETTRWMARLSRWMRASATMMHLAYSLRNVMQQFPAALIAGKEVGFVKYIQAMASFASSPKVVIAEIREKSRFMRNRAQVVNREAKEFMKKMVSTSQTGAAWESFKSHGFILQTTVDMMVAYPAWYAAYSNSMEKHGEEARAITEADQVVAESVGSGSDLHLGRIMQSNQNEFVKTFTIFGSWFNAYYQRLYKASKGGQDFLSMAFLGDAVIMPLFVATLTQMIIFDFPDEDEDWPEYILENGLLFMTATMPLIRDLASLSKGFTPGTPLGAIVAAPHRGVAEIRAYIEGRQSGTKLASDLGRQIGQVFKMPGSGNVWRTLDYLDSYYQGKEGKFNPAQMLLEGSNKND